jgi:hypothetical protein
VGEASLIYIYHAWETREGERKKGRKERRKNAPAPFVLDTPHCERMIAT